MESSRIKVLPKIGYIFTLLLVIVLTVTVTIFRSELVEIATYGYVGVFLACLAANSTVFLPAPSSAIVFVSASIYSPFWIAIIGGLGASVGELIGYVAGYSGRQVIRSNKRELQIQRYVDQYGALAVFVFALLPLPLFDLVGVIAGASRLSLAHFLIPCVFGKVLKMFMYAYAGAGILPLIMPHIGNYTKGLLQ